MYLSYISYIGSIIGHNGSVETTFLHRNNHTETNTIKLVSRQFHQVIVPTTNHHTTSTPLLQSHRAVATSSCSHILFLFGTTISSSPDHVTVAT